MPSNPFDQFDAPAAQPRRADPIVKPADPYKPAAESRAQAGEMRAQQDQQLQMQSARREEERLALARQDQTRQNEQAALGSESERTAGFLSKRIVDAVGRMGGAIKKDSSAAAPSFGVEATRGILGNTVANYLTDSERQQVRAAQIDILDSGLTLGTGAAYTKEQIEGYREVYFPALGDTEETIASKRDALRSLLESARVKAGRSAPDIASAIAALESIDGGSKDKVEAPPVAAGGNTPPDNGPTFKPDGSVSFGKDNYKGDFDPGGGVIVPTQAAQGQSYSTANDLAMAAAMQSLYNKGGSVQDMLGLARQYGFPAETQNVREWQDAIDYRDGTGRFKGQRRGLSQVNVPRSGTRSLISQGMGSIANTGPGAAAIAAGDVASFGTLDELVGASRAAANGTNYENERDYANFAKQATMEESPWWSAGGMLLGGAGQAASLGKVGVNALAKFAPAASAKLAGLSAAGQAATSGAIQGGLYGAGTENENRLLGTALGAGLGGGLGALAGKGAQALANRGRPATGLVDESTPFIGAAQRQDVPIREPDINPGVRGNAGALGQSEKGGPIIGAAMADDAAAIEAGVARAGGTGTASDRFGTGERVQGVLTRQGDTTRTAARSQYERAERLSGDPAIEPAIAIKKLADEIVALEANPNTNAAEIKLLTGLGEDLSAPGGKRISDLRAMRSNIRTQLRADGLDRTPAEARALGIIDAASADIEQGLVNNPAALAAYKKGDQIWRERAQFRQDITRRLMGTRDRPFSPEETGRAVESLVKSDGKRTMTLTLLAEMQPAERLDFAASIASNLGRNAKGDFSLPILLNNLDTRRGIVSPRATAVIFGKEGAEALKDLRLIAQTKLEGQSARNSSNTGGVVSRNTKGLRTALFTAMGYGSGGITGAVVAPMAERFMANLGEERAARLLMNPNLTKWIRNAPNSAEPAVINRHFERLSSLANRNLIASADIEAFKNAMMAAVANSPGRAAAQDEADAGRKPPQ